MNKVYPYRWFDDEQIELISRHKFALCFENSRDDEKYYISEKILNAKLSGAIPIYWGSSKCLELFEQDSFLFLEDNTQESFKRLLEKIKELDNDDDKYIQMRNKRLVDPNKINHLRRESIKHRIHL
jgi:hypothetical protein